MSMQGQADIWKYSAQNIRPVLENALLQDGHIGFWGSSFFLEDSPSSVPGVESRDDEARPEGASKAKFTGTSCFRLRATNRSA